MGKQYNCIQMQSTEFKTAFALLWDSFRLWWADWVNQVLISLALVLVSLTVFLGGPAILGVWAVAADLVDGNRTGLPGWWEGFKRYFWPGLLWGILNLFALFLLGTNLWFYSQIASFWAPVLVVLFISLGLFWTVLQFYLPGYLIEQSDKSVWLALKNSFITALAAPFLTAILGGFFLLLTLISLGLFLPILIGTIPLLGVESVLAVRNRLAVYGVRDREGE